MGVWIILWVLLDSAFWCRIVLRVHGNIPERERKGKQSHSYYHIRKRTTNTIHIVCVNTCQAVRCAVTGTNPFDATCQAALSLSAPPHQLTHKLICTPTHTLLVPCVRREALIRTFVCSAVFEMMNSSHSGKNILKCVFPEIGYWDGWLAGSSDSVCMYIYLVCVVLYNAQSLALFLYCLYGCCIYVVCMVVWSVRLFSIPTQLCTHNFG